MKPDFRDLLRALSAAGARIDPAPANAERVYQALRSFGVPLDERSEADLSIPDVVSRSEWRPDESTS